MIFESSQNCRQMNHTPRRNNLDAAILSQMQYNAQNLNDMHFQNQYKIPQKVTKSLCRPIAGSLGPANCCAHLQYSSRSASRFRRGWEHGHSGASLQSQLQRDSSLRPSSQEGGLYQSWQHTTRVYITIIYIYIYQFLIIFESSQNRRQMNHTHHRNILHAAILSQMQYNAQNLNDMNFKNEI